jgi:hypothetical protein
VTTWAFFPLAPVAAAATARLHVVCHRAIGGRLGVMSSPRRRRRTAPTRHTCESLGGAVRDRRGRPFVCPSDRPHGGGGQLTSVRMSTEFSRRQCALYNTVPSRQRIADGKAFPRASERVEPWALQSCVSLAGGRRRGRRRMREGTALEAIIPRAGDRSIMLNVRLSNVSRGRTLPSLTSRFFFYVKPRFVT